MLSALFAIVEAGTVTRTYQFDQPQIIIENGQAMILLENAPNWSSPGEPLLPSAPVQLLLTPGEEAQSITVELADPVIIGGGYSVIPAEFPQPISEMFSSGNTPINGEIYSSNELFPVDYTSSLQTHFLAGHSISTALIHPVSYRPLSGEIAYYPWIRVTVHSQPTQKAAAAYSEKLKRNRSIQERLNGLVQNPEMISVYGVQTPSRPDTWDMLIITMADFVDDYQNFIDYKNLSGLYTTVETVEDIYASYTGIDNQDKIRNCIIDYYENYDISYVFLCGDNEHIPCRRFWVQAGSYEEDIPSDLYYCCLDGTWNDDLDDHWGEPNEADWFAEVFIGRSCADTPDEIANFTAKTELYQTAPVTNEVETGLMIGEDMGWQSWGSEYKEEIRLGSSNYGYVTAGFPTNFEVDTLYDYAGYSWSAMWDLLPMLNEGPSLVNHMGHAGWNYVLKFDLDEINDNNFTNNGVNHNFFIGFSQGCHAGNFEHNNDDCIIEEFTSIANGAVGFVANSRYGWGVSSGTNGASQRFDREFFDAIFGEDISLLGWVNQDSKEDNVAWTTDDYIRWCYYELNLFGDPSLDIWTETPGEYFPEYSSTALYNAQEFVVNNVPVIGSLVTISANGEILGQTESIFTGDATVIFEAPLQQTGDLDLTITSHNMIPYTGMIHVVEPYIELTPQGTPISIPSSGGSFDFNILVGNFSIYETTADIWCDVTLPNGTNFGPVLGPITDFNLPSSWTGNRDKSQAIPAGAPSGTYSYNAYIGIYPDIISDQDSFDFDKTGDDGSGDWLSEWILSGEGFDELGGGNTKGDSRIAPTQFALLQVTPNPFNPSTAISYQLSAFSHVNLAIYDVSGRKVAELVDGWRDAGVHEVTFDGSELASSVYIYRLVTGDFTANGKMVLMK